MVFFGTSYFHTHLMVSVFNAVFLLFLIIEGITACFSLINSIKSAKESEKSDRGSMLLIMAGIVVSVLSSPLLILAVPYVLPDPVFWVGIFVSILGIAVRIVSILTLRRFFTFSVQVGKKQELVRNGPYKFLRHPAYTGSILTLLGIALSFRSPLGIAVTVITCAVVYGYRIRVEEREMEKNFGTSYLTYERQTWRIIPFVW